MPTTDFDKHWRTVTIAGLLGMVYYETCVFGAPRTKFLVALDATPFDFGLMASLGAVTMAFQLLSAALANHLTRRKLFWIGLFIVHRLLMLGVLAAPLLFAGGRARIWWIIGVMLVHNVLVHTGDPIWFSWMSDLVPRATFNRHWADRQRFITAGSIVVGLTIALLFSWFERTGRVLLGFGVLGSAAVVLGVIDICMFLRIPEPPPHAEPDITLREAMTEPLRNDEFRPFLLFRAYWQFAIMFSAPFFHLFLIRELNMSVVTLQVLIALHGVGVVAASGMWGRICDSHGYRPVLQMIVAVKFLVPLTYMLLPQEPLVYLPVLAVLFLLDGMVNAAGALAFQGVALQTTPRRNRAMFIAASNFVALGLAGGLAPLLAGVAMRYLNPVMALDWGPYRVTGFHVIFLVSCLLRLSGLALVSRIREAGSESVGRVLARIRTERPFWAWPLR